MVHIKEIIHLFTMNIMEEIFEIRSLGSVSLLTKDLAPISHVMKSTQQIQRTTEVLQQLSEWNDDVTGCLITSPSGMTDEAGVRCFATR